MSKRKVSHKQAAQIYKIQQQRLTRAARKAASIEDIIANQQLGSEQAGLLISHFGTQAEVENEHGAVIRCLIRQNIGALVAGDRVIWQSIDNETGVIVARQPRTAVLGRPDKNGEIKPVAANIDQMFIIIAPQPRIVSSLLDSYLVAAELLGIEPIIVLNKIDLLAEQQQAETADLVACYTQLNYQLVRTSVLEKDNIQALTKHLRAKTSVFVGQSGVGKSSIIGQLIPQVSIRVGALKQGVHGSHTTSNSRLYHLECGGHLIDSPGVRDFALWHMPIEHIARGYREFQPLLGRCKFRNCQHVNEPDCALITAVKSGQIHPQRLKNFHSLTQGKP